MHGEVYKVRKHCKWFGVCRAVQQKSRLIVCTTGYRVSESTANDSVYVVLHSKRCRSEGTLKDVSKCTAMKHFQIAVYSEQTQEALFSDQIQKCTVCM